MTSIGSRFRYRLTTLLWLTLVGCTCLAWYADHRRLEAESSRSHPAIATYSEKHPLWSPSLHLGFNTEDIESRLSHRVPSFTGTIVQSRQGLADARLRQPTWETLDSVVELMSESDDATVLDATRLVALYLESYSGRDAIDAESMAIKRQFHERGLAQTQTLLKHSSSEIRQAAALILGNTLPSRTTVEHMSELFDHEADVGTKQYLAWSYCTLTTLPK